LSSTGFQPVREACRVVRTVKNPCYLGSHRRFRRRLRPICQTDSPCASRTAPTASEASGFTSGTFPRVGRGVPDCSGGRGALSSAARGRSLAGHARFRNLQPHGGFAAHGWHRTHVRSRHNCRIPYCCGHCGNAADCRQNDHRSRAGPRHCLRPAMAREVAGTTFPAIRSDRKTIDNSADRLRADGVR
jgi:hypothetical protein